MDTPTARKSTPDTISSNAMTDAGIDISRVWRRTNPADTSVPTWHATSADGTTRIVFGVELDPEGLTPEGEHTGWCYGLYELIETEGEVEEYFLSGDYFGSAELAGLLAMVARIVPAGAVS